MIHNFPFMYLYRPQSKTHTGAAPYFPKACNQYQR